MPQKHYIVTVHLTTHTWNVASSLKISFSANSSSSSRCWKSTQKRKWRLWSWGFSICNSCSRYPLTQRRLCRMCQTLEWGIYNSWLAQCVDFWGLLTNVSCTRSTVLADGPSQPVRFAAYRQPLCWNFTYHSRIVLSVDGSVRYMVRNLHRTVKIDSVLANSKTQNAILFPVHTMSCHHCPLAVKPESMAWCLVHQKKKNLERFSTYWYAPFCCVSLGCCAADFGSSWGTYKLPCILQNLIGKGKALLFPPMTKTRLMGHKTPCQQDWPFIVPPGLTFRFHLIRRTSRNAYQMCLLFLWYPDTFLPFITITCWNPCFHDMLTSISGQRFRFCYANSTLSKCWHRQNWKHCVLFRK